MSYLVRLYPHPIPAKHVLFSINKIKPELLGDKQDYVRQKESFFPGRAQKSRNKAELKTVYKNSFRRYCKRFPLTIIAKDISDSEP